MDQIRPELAGGPQVDAAQARAPEAVEVNRESFEILAPLTRGRCRVTLEADHRFAPARGNLASQPKRLLLSRPAQVRPTDEQGSQCPCQGAQS